METRLNGNVAKQCRNMKVIYAPTTCNTSEVEENRKIIMLKVPQYTMYAGFFSVYSEINRSLIVIGLFAQVLAKLLLNNVIFIN